MFLSKYRETQTISLYSQISWKRKKIKIELFLTKYLHVSIATTLYSS